MSLNGLKPFWKTKRETMTHYNTTAISYDQLYSDEQAKKFDTALQTLGSLREKRVLDIGCGTGLLIQRISKYRASIIGIDFSKEMLKGAFEKFKKLKNIHFICGDADFLPFKEQVFDKVFSFTLLQNMPMPETTLKEALRVTKSDSNLVFTGQKKYFSKDDFLNLLLKLGLLVERFFEQGLTDYVAVCVKG